MRDKLEQLRQQLATIYYLNRAQAVLGWDQQTQMPPGGAQARGETLAALGELTHEKATSSQLGKLLAAAEEEVAGLPADNVDAALVRVARRDYDQNVKIPAQLVAEIQRHSTAAHEVWVKARAENDYASFAPMLQKTVELSRESAECLGYQDRIYDALLDLYEPGMRTAQVEKLFADLRQEIVPLVHAIAERQDRVDDSVLHQAFDEAKQEAFGKRVVTDFGYDWSRGRQDRAVHPFAISFSPTDVRITTRFEPDFLNPALFGTMHEAGHGMYEQGIALELEPTPLAGAASLGMHESQSRMWENVVGRSHGIWEHYYRDLQGVFPEQLGSVDLDTFYGAINEVEPTFIRVEADEVTYNLHIMLRFEMEQALLEGTLSVEDAPDVWNEKMQEYLGITPPSDSLGILQDVHWSGGMMGYFPTYTLGNILSVQLYDAAVRAHPEIPEQITQGRFFTLHDWLENNIYRFGQIFDPNDLVERATGQPLNTTPYIRYLKEKYGAIYGLEAAAVGV